MGRIIRVNVFYAFLIKLFRTPFVGIKLQDLVVHKFWQGKNMKHVLCLKNIGQKNDLENFVPLGLEISEQQVESFIVFPF